MNELSKEQCLELFNSENLIVKNYDDIITGDVISFPLTDISALGTAFSSIASAISAVNYVTGQGKTLYEATFPSIGHLAESSGGKIGTVLSNKTNQIIGQARFREVGKVTQSATNAGMLFMALAIMAINKSLKNISENQKSILNFLEIDKQTQLKGDLLTLTDILTDYQHNWDNEQYLVNREIQVLDIKRSSEQNILFYKEIIESKFKKNKLIHLDTAKNLNDTQNKFKYYQLSLYLYAYSSFLDIMLLRNFDEKYLESVSDKIKNYSLEYEEFFNKSLEDIEAYTNSSIQARALQGIAIAGKFAGKQIAKIPDRDNKIKVDDKLISGSKKIDKFQNESVTKTVEAFNNVENSGIDIFIDKISLINQMYNHPMKVLFDKENIYLPTNT